MLLTPARLAVAGGNLRLKLKSGGGKRWKTCKGWQSMLCQISWFPRTLKTFFSATWLQSFFPGTHQTSLSYHRFIVEALQVLTRPENPWWIEAASLSFTLTSSPETTPRSHTWESPTERSLHGQVVVITDTARARCDGSQDSVSHKQRYQRVHQEKGETFSIRFHCSHAWHYTTEKRIPAVR